LCWSDAVLIEAADMSLIRSQSEVIKEFNNFMETWENVTATEERFGDLKGLFAFSMKMRALLEELL